MNKKRLISLSALLLALASNSAQAWFFFFLPGSATGAISDAITGSKGNNCVGSTVKVGDTIRLTDGSTGIVKSLSGTSSRCTNSEFPIRALLVPSTEPNAGVTPAFHSNAGIELSEDWEVQTVTDQMKSNHIFFTAFNRKNDVGLQLAAVKPVGNIDMMNYVERTRTRQANGLVDGRPTEIEQTRVLGMPAWRFEVTGGAPRNPKIRLTFMDTMIDSGTEVLLVTTYASAENFPKQKAMLIGLTDGVRGLTASPPPVGATQQAPLAIPNPPVVTTPPSPAAAAPAQTPESQGSISTRLEVLNKLYKDGLITEKNFESKKQEILRGL